MQKTQGDKRKTQRLRRKMAVLFEHDARVRAQTTNISHSGLCIASDFIAAPGTIVGGTLALPSGESANFEAAVIWARKVRGADMLTDKNTMGLEFIIPPGEHYAALFGGAAPPVLAVPPLATAPMAAAAPVPSPALAPAPAPAPAAPPVTAVPLMATSEHPASSPGPVWAAAPTGQVGRATATVQPHHLAAPADRFAASIGPASAAAWIEQACVEAVAAQISPFYTTVGVGLQLTVPQHPPLEIGSQVTATARVAQISPDGHTLIFEVSISDGRREVAFGKHSRQVCSPRS